MNRLILILINSISKSIEGCPAFKIITYYGSTKERKLKRQVNYYFSHLSKSFFLVFRLSSKSSK